jgi:hypothetical protein
MSEKATRRCTLALRLVGRHVELECAHCTFTLTQAQRGPIPERCRESNIPSARPADLIAPLRCRVDPSPVLAMVVAVDDAALQLAAFGLVFRIRGSPELFGWNVA